MVSNRKFGCAPSARKSLKGHKCGMDKDLDGYQCNMRWIENTIRKTRLAKEDNVWHDTGKMRDLSLKVHKVSHANLCFKREQSRALVREIFSAKDNQI